MGCFVRCLPDDGYLQVRCELELPPSGNAQVSPVSQVPPIKPLPPQHAWPAAPQAWQALAPPEVTQSKPVLQVPPP